MSLFKKLAGKFAPGGSGELEKIRLDAEKRRAARSSASLAKVSGDPLEATIASLNNRIERKQ